MPNKQRQPNTRLRRARGDRSQEQLAELVNTEIQRATGRAGAVTAKAISDWERGWYTWPAKPSRDALCAVLDVADPAELGFRPQRVPGPAGDPTAAGGPAAVILSTDEREPCDPMRRTFLLGGAATIGTAGTAGGAGGAGRVPPAWASATVSLSDPHGFAAALTDRWPATSVARPVPDRGTDWQIGLPGGRAFDGADVAIQVHRDIRCSSRTATIDPPARRFEQFTRPRNRSLLIAADDRVDGGAFYALDARAARTAASAAVREQTAVQVPRAYLLDDLTFGALWAVANLDAALLDDDASLHRHRLDLTHYEGLPGSAASRDEAPDLAPVSQMWLGSEFCARHILRNLDRLDSDPVFWTREQRGEEASTWLLWRHKLAYLRQTSQTGTSVARGFCLPEHVVEESPRHERILLVLSAALMEACGIRTCVTPDPAYGDVEGFVLGGRAIVANWIRTPGLWQVDTTASRSRVAGFAETAGHVAAHSIIDGPTPARRLAALAAYLRIPWPWLRNRCAELAAHGLDHLAPPRSRLLTIDGLNIATRYIGQLTKP